MGPPSPLEALTFAWPFLVVVGLMLIAAIIAMTAIRRSKRGYRKVGSGTWEKFPGELVAGFIDAKPTNRAPAGDSMDRRFITFHLQYRDEQNRLQTYQDRPTRAAAVRRSIHERFFRFTMRSVAKVNLKIHDPVERARAEELARTEGYLMRLQPPIPVTIYRSRDGEITWDLA